MNSKRIIIGVGLVAAIGVLFAYWSGMMTPKKGVEATTGGAARFEPGPDTEKDAKGEQAPRVAKLEQNRPNPFNPTTVIPYDTGPGGHVTLRVFDASGRLVRTLVDADLPSGVQQATWDARDDRGADVASGRYFCRLNVGSVVETRTMTLLR
jgi:hypothetical protein